MISGGGVLLTGGSHPMNHVFVYGTLKRKHPYHESNLAGEWLIGCYRTCHSYPLVVAGRWFSPVLIDERGSGQRVLGELYGVGDEVLARLDELEGTHVPHGYQRSRVPIEPGAGGGLMEVWAYFKSRAQLEIIHDQDLEEYLPDPRYVPGWRRG